MGVPVSIDEALHEQARAEAPVEHRTIAGQIDIGQLLGVPRLIIPICLSVLWLKHWLRCVNRVSSQHRLCHVHNSMNDGVLFGHPPFILNIAQSNPAPTLT